jgi:hypothetical protein
MKNRLLSIGTIVWVIATLLLLVFFPDLASVLGILMLGVQLAFLAFAINLLVCALARMRRSPRVATVCALIIVGGLVFAFTGGRSWGESARFAIVRHSYEHRLQEILSSFERGTPMESRYAEYEIEPGPPVRVAFMWQAGVTDNWVGLVYDPTGIVMKANEFKRDWSNWKDPALEPVKRLFGGDIVQTRHFKDHWYLCVFT